MAHTFQKTLELAGGLSKLQSQLQKLQIAEKPKKRHLRRNAALVASTLAAGAIAAVVVFRSRSRRAGAVAGDGGDAQAGFEDQTTPDAKQDWEGPATDVDAPQNVAIPAPA
jgi:hypothetical protein